MIAPERCNGVRNCDLEAWLEIWVREGSANTSMTKREVRVGCGRGSWRGSGSPQSTIAKGVARAWVAWSSEARVRSGEGCHERCLDPEKPVRAYLGLG
jgi:hypothetical protein